MKMDEPEYYDELGKISSIYQIATVIYLGLYGIGKYIDSASSNIKEILNRYSERNIEK